jgi:pimeloyl-ACP methyl ester carboxylesterase
MRCRRQRAALCSDLRHSFTPPFVQHVALALTELELPRVARAPVLVLVGGRELWGSRAAARRVVGRVQGARGGVVPGVGHLWNLQAPDLFVAVLRAWVGGGAVPAAVQPL